MILVKHILEAARKRLAVLSREASLFDAARILANRDTPLVVVCDSDGIAVGMISSSHVVNVLATAGVDALGFNAGAIMTKPVLSCHVDETLQQVWAVMTRRPCHVLPFWMTMVEPKASCTRATLRSRSSTRSIMRSYCCATM